MKRFFALLWAAALLAGLCACGSERDVPEVMPEQDFGSEGEVFASGVFDAAPETVERRWTDITARKRVPPAWAGGT